jgi:hypothetical protein
MELDDCRELARSINGTPSLSSLSLVERSELIEILKEKGARVHNPKIPGLPATSQGSRKSHCAIFPFDNAVPRRDGTEGVSASNDNVRCPVKWQEAEKKKDAYANRLEEWNSKFPNHRPGFASNKELAWIQTLWDLNFADGRAGSGSGGLRGFVFRQTQNLPEGPVSDLAFLRVEHVRAVLTPLKAKASAAMKRNSNRPLWRMPA